MFAITLALLVLCQHMSTSLSTRLPLEVYELTQARTATLAATLANAGTNSNLLHLKHKSLEYSTMNLNKSPAAAAAANTDILTDIADADADADAIHEDDATELTILDLDDERAMDIALKHQQHEWDRRRSRQVLDIVRAQNNNNNNNNNNNDLNNNKLFYKNNNNNNNHNIKKSNINKKHNNKDVRILYQVGDCEGDLPVCAPNAICSKIDLYETPWIERQCRCPESHRLQYSYTIHHHHANNNNNNNHKNNNNNSYINKNANNNNNNNQNNELYHSYYEQEKLLQQRHLLAGADLTDKPFESLHLKKLMQKLGAVYEEDLQLQPSDYLLASATASTEHQVEDNDAISVSSESNDSDKNSHSVNNEFSTHIQSSYRLPTSTYVHHGARHIVHKQLATTAPTANTHIGGCPSGLGIDDGHTIVDKTRHYKLCQPIHKLQICKFFRDYTWTLRTSLEMNVTEQIVHCRCPRNSITYLTKREPDEDGLNSYTYYFACSPITRLRCRRKQPCKLFTVRKRQEFLDEVNINSLCQCPKGHHCPSHHTHSGVITGESFLEDNIQTYSGYCMAND